MGLCRCRNVTSFFCFEHRKNVCEQCVVVASDHGRCVVKSYLQWLQDSEWDDHCVCCGMGLKDPLAEVIRLPCFDLIHVKCLATLVKNGPLKSAICPYPTCQAKLLTVPPPSGTLNLSLALVETLKPLVPTEELLSIQRALNELKPLSICDSKATDRLLATAAAPSPPTAQPNLVAIEMGIRPSYNHETSPEMNNLLLHQQRAAAGRKTTTSATLSISWKGGIQVLRNFVMLRNVRSLLGSMAPRQLVLILLACTVGVLLLIRCL